MLRAFLVAGVVWVLALSSSGVASAQSRKEKKEEASQRNLQGTVTDAGEKPVPGAVVQLKDMRTLQVRSFVAQSDGSYRFSGLKIDNDYQVKADFNNTTSDWRTLSVFDTRKTPIINLRLEKK